MMTSSPSWTSFDPSPFFADEKIDTSTHGNSSKLALGWSAGINGIKQPSTPGTPATKFGGKSVGTATTASISPSTSTSSPGADDYEQDENDQQHPNININPWNDDDHEEDHLVRPQVLEMDRIFEGPKVPDMPDITPMPMPTPTPTTNGNANGAHDSSRPTHRRDTSDASSWSWLEKKYHANQQKQHQEASKTLSSPQPPQEENEETVIVFEAEEAGEDDIVEGDDTYASSWRDRDHPKSSAKSFEQQQQQEEEHASQIPFDLEEFRDLACTSMDKAADFWGQVQTFFRQGQTQEEEHAHAQTRDQRRHSPLKAALAVATRHHASCPTTPDRSAIPRTIRTPVRGGSLSDSRHRRKNPSRHVAETLGLDTSHMSGPDEEESLGANDEDEDVVDDDDVSSMTEPVYSLPEDFRLEPAKFPTSKRSRQPTIEETKTDELTESTTSSPSKQKEDSTGMESGMEQARCVSILGDDEDEEDDETLDRLHLEEKSIELNVEDDVPETEEVDILRLPGPAPLKRLESFEC